MSVNMNYRGPSKWQICFNMLNRIFINLVRFVLNGIAKSFHLVLSCGNYQVVARRWSGVQRFGDAWGDSLVVCPPSKF